MVPIESSASCTIDIVDWHIFLLNMLEDICFFNEIISNSVLLINITKNNTNYPLQTIKITNILIELFTKNISRYSTISMEQLYRVYRELEVSSEEILNSYEFSVKIARYLKADYIIYSSIYENFKNLYLELQLILSKTGEIICVINKPFYTYK